MILEINKWTNPCNAFNQTDWGGNEDMVIEFQFLIASFLAFTAGFLALKNQSYRTIFNEMNNTIDWIVLYPTE